MSRVDTDASRGARLVAVTNVWPPMAAGAGQLLRGMVGRREDTLVLAPRSAAPEPRTGARVVPAFRFSGRTGGPLKIWSVLQQLEVALAPALWSLARSRRPSLFVCVMALPAGVGGWIARRLFGVPYVVLAHGEELTLLLQDRAPFGLRLRLQRLALRDAAAVVCNTAHTRSLAARHYGIAESRLRVIHPAIDPPHELEPVSQAIAWRDRLVGSNARILLMVGRLSEVHKGFDTAIAAMPAIRRAVPDATLVIAGPGDQSALRAAAAEAADAVVFTGLLERDDLLRLFRTCDVFLMPGRAVGLTAEGFGIVYLEAARFGRPAVAGRAGGAPEAVVHGETGLVVDGESPADVAAAVVRLLTDRAYAERLGRCAQDRVLRDFDGVLQHRQFDALVQELLAPESSRA